jgi:hypothetical protein
VLSLYAAERFRDDQSATLQFVVPHLAHMFHSLEKRAVDAAPAVPVKQPLRMISSR